MMKLISTVLMIVGCVVAKPNWNAALHGAPLVASPYVAASSSQVVHRNYNGIAAPLVAAAPAPLAYSSPYTAAYTAPFAAAYSAYSAPFAAAYSAPLNAAYATGSPYAYAPYTSAYAAPFVGAPAPLKYTAAPVLL